MAWVPALRRWPRTLASRLFLIFLVGLVLAHALSFSLLFYDCLLYTSPSPRD